MSEAMPGLLASFDHPGSLFRKSVRVVALGLLLLETACTPLDNAMAAVFGRSMRDQPSIGTHENPLDAPEGSVPFAVGNVVAWPGEVNLPNPVRAAEASAARGEELFLRFCAACHGPDGTGVTGSIISAGYPPHSLVSDQVLGFTDGHIYGMIRRGRGPMPPFGYAINHLDRWNVVNYLRALHGVVPMALPAESHNQTEPPQL